MRFMMIVKADKDHEAGRPPKPELMEAVGKLTEEGRKAGRVLSNGGLLPSAKGARIRVGGGKLTVVDGPFAESKELIGGFAIIEASSKEDAIEQGSRFLQLHADILGPEYEGELEVRQMYQPAECGDWKE
jgi:hypothetical protein